MKNYRTNIQRMEGGDYIQKLGLPNNATLSPKQHTNDEYDVLWQNIHSKNESKNISDVKNAVSDTKNKYKVFSGRKTGIGGGATFPEHHTIVIDNGRYSEEGIYEHEISHAYDNNPALDLSNKSKTELQQAYPNLHFNSVYGHGKRGEEVADTERRAMNNEFRKKLYDEYKYNANKKISFNRFIKKYPEEKLLDHMFLLPYLDQKDYLKDNSKENFNPFEINPNDINKKKIQPVKKAIMNIAQNTTTNPYVTYAKRGGIIHINPKNKGKFTASAKRAGMSVQEFAKHVLANKDKYSTTQVRRANFAKNAKRFKHKNGGTLNSLDFIKTNNPFIDKPNLDNVRELFDIYKKTNNGKDNKTF